MTAPKSATPPTTTHPPRTHGGIEQPSGNNPNETRTARGTIPANMTPRPIPANTPAKLTVRSILGK